VKRKSYDARVRAVYKRAVKALGGGITWRQICRVESSLAWSQRELLLDGDADPASPAGRSGRVVQVKLPPGIGTSVSLLPPFTRGL